MKLAIFCAVLAALAVAQETATVEGVVVNKVTGAGIEGVTVWIWSGNTDSYKVVTNEAGFFQVAGLKPGDYSSRAEKSGYTNPGPAVLPDPLTDAPKQRISPGAEPVRLRFELIPPSVLRGRVIGVDGNPARAVIELNPGKTADTDPEGRFSLENLAPGQYILLARPKLTEHVSGKDEIRTEPVPTFYPSVQDRSLAETITVRAGAELNGYEIRLQSAEVHRVHGIVLDPEGKPSAKATVELRPKVPDDTGITFNGVGPGGLIFSMRSGRGAGQSEEVPVVTSEDGVFEFPSVRSGEWTIQVHSDWVRDEIQKRNTLRFGSAAFRVEHQDPDELKIPFATPFNLSLPAVVVLGDGSPPTPGVSVSVMLMSETASTVQGAETGASGTLQFGNVLPGTHQIRAEVRAGNYYVDSIWLGSTNVMGQSVELTPIPLPLKIVLKPAGTVRGTIEEADAGEVLLFPQSLAGAGYMAQSGAGRTFEITGIPPGEYYAIALDRFAILDPLSLRGLMPRSTSVRVEQGSSASVQLKVNHVPD